MLSKGGFARVVRWSYNILPGFLTVIGGFSSQTCPHVRTLHNSLLLRGWEPCSTMTTGTSRIALKTPKWWYQEIHHFNGNSGKSSCQHIGSKLFQLASSNSTDGRMLRVSPRTKGAKSCQWSTDKLKLRIFQPSTPVPHQDLSQAPLRQWPGSPVKWYINARTWRIKTSKSIAASRYITKPLPHLVLDPKIHSHHIQATARNEPQACCTSSHQPKDEMTIWFHEPLTAAPQPKTWPSARSTRCPEGNRPRANSVDASQGKNRKITIEK